jgi:hypothetical protein
MKDDPCTSITAVVEGQILRISEGHEVAIYKRNGVHWVAEFRDGRGELVDATSWFHFHTGALRYSFGNRAAALNSASAITPEVLAQIEHLHGRADNSARASILTALANAVRRWASIGVSRMRKSTPRRAQELV